MIIRILQKENASIYNEPIYAEFYNPQTKTWHFTNKRYTALKDAKIKRVDDKIYLAGTAITKNGSLEEDTGLVARMQATYLQGEELDWTSSDTFPYVEFLDYLEAYY